MSALVDPSEIERIVGIPRPRGRTHFGRAVSAEQTVYILHSQKCLDSGIDLRECPFSLALDPGIEPRRWEGKEDRPVLLGIWEGRLVPTKDMSDGTLVSLR